MTLALRVGPRELDTGSAGGLGVELDVDVAVFSIVGGVNDGNNASDVGDGAGCHQVAHHVYEILGGIERVFLKRFERGDALLVNAQFVVGLAQMDVDLEGVEGRREVRTELAMI